MIVSDSTPLIYLAKLGNLPLIRKLFDKVRVPSEVMAEIMRGKGLGFEDAAVIEEAEQEGWLKTVALGGDQKGELLKLCRTFVDISRVDAAVLILAKSPRGAICVDDSRAVKVAEVLGLKHIGTLGIILLSVKRGLLSKGQAEQMALSLPERGFYVDAGLLSEFLRQLKRA